MRPHGLHRHFDPQHPRAKAICDRCGFAYQHDDLVWQKEWAGKTLVNLGWLVCQTCLDEPNAQLKSLSVGGDPRPIKDPRPEFFDNTRTDYLINENKVDALIDESGNLLIRD